MVANMRLHVSKDVLLFAAECFAIAVKSGSVRAIALQNNSNTQFMNLIGMVEPFLLLCYK